MLKPYLKINLTLFLLGMSSAIFSQNVGINTTGTTPSINAILDLNTGNLGNLGFIIPNVTLGVSLATFNPPIAHAPTAADNGMMVYNSVATNQPLGYYYWNSTLNSWVSAGGSGGGGGLSSCGGATINYIPYFTSTTDICNSVLYQGSTTTLGVGTTTPQNMLDVNGAVAIGSYAGTNAAPAGTSMIVSGQVGIGTNTPNPAALLDLTSTSLGLLVPRMTVAQIAAIANPAIGLVVYNTTTNCLEFNSTGTSTGWNDIVCPCNSPPGSVGTITGPSTICSGTSGTYSIASVTDATTYTWSSSNTSIAFLSSANGSTSATFTGGSVSGYVTITVVASNSCGSTLNTITILNGVPPNATIPVGNITPSISTTSTYTCAAVPNATAYTWSVSSTNATITSGQGTQTVTVAFDATPTVLSICVTASNACGSSTPACLAVSSIPCPTTASTISFSWNGSTNYYTGSVQTWTVPSCANTITVTLVGGSGGNCTGTGYSGGLAASLTGTVTVTPGDVLDIIVGGQGTDLSCGGFSCYGASGGGGTFIWDATTNTPLAVAGGGGGASAVGPNGVNATINITSLTNLETPTATTGGAGGSGGNAGSQGGANADCGGGGAGWLTNATVTGWAATAYYPESGITPGYGMKGADADDGYGGFGGGGGGAYNAGGGGGGYNGGGGGSGNAGLSGNPGGGGGGFWQAGNFPPTNAAYGSSSSNGSVTITYY